MLGIIPNWDLDNKKGKVTKEKQIFDHLVKNIGNAGLQSQVNGEDEVKTKKKKKKSKSFFQKIFSGERSNRSFADRFVIKVDSPLYQFWKIFVVFICIISSYIYAYIAAFGKDKQIEYIVLFFEIIFAMDIIVRKYFYFASILD